MTFLSSAKLKRSFQNAFTGLKLLWREQSFRIQIIIAFVVVILMYLLKLETQDKITLLFVIILVLGAETINTLLEKLIDHLHPAPHDRIALIKDALAGLVLIFCFFAVVIGLLIFSKYI
ncbi:MAG: diacylglycerol kinase family protein [Patescibacteria group bacterium]|nr:diacylglycerol kinase family protein [Patescibacteria group bacterium]